jgi:molecular chaperone GrpE
MSERTPPGVSEETTDDRAPALTPERIESVLTDFRAWLREAAEKGATAPPPEPDAETIDLHTLLAQFTALRHEVNLQTRAVRAQQEHNTETLRQLGQALELLRQTPAPAGSNGQPVVEESLRAQLKTLVELYDALSLAAREVQRGREALSPTLDRLAAEPPVVPASTEAELATFSPSRPQPGFWSRLAGWTKEEPPEAARMRSTIATLREALAAERQQNEDARHAARRARQLLDSILTGYTMSLQRLERALRQHEIEPIPCVGEPFDPERMEVLEVVSDSGLPSGQVIEEVRRGYLWRGRVFRFAQVRVAKS